MKRGGGPQIRGIQMSRMYWLIGILGLLLSSAPFALGFAANPAALWTSVLLGLAVVAVSAFQGLRHNTTPWEYWVAGILGILAVGSPFALGFAGLHPALYSSLVLGVLVVLLAVYQIFVVEYRNQ